jgi:hypothetical protein
MATYPAWPWAKRASREAPDQMVVERELLPVAPWTPFDGTSEHPAGTLELKIHYFAQCGKVSYWPITSASRFGPGPLLAEPDMTAGAWMGSACPDLPPLIIPV